MRETHCVGSKDNLEGHFGGHAEYRVIVEFVEFWPESGLE